MNSEIDIQVGNIQQKLQQLLKQYELLQKENRQLQKELENERSKAGSTAQTIQVLQQQAGILKLGSDSWSKEEKIAFKKRIDAYLKDIDHCITLLNAE